MITLSEAVLDELKRLRGRTERTFRIEPGCSCCHSPTLELILDEPEDDDVTTEVSGFTFCIRKRMLDQLGNVRIEADHAEGYRIFSERSLSSFVKNGRLCASERAGNVSGPFVLPAKAGFACTRAGSSMKIQLPHILPPEPIPRVTPAQRRILLLPR